MADSQLTGSDYIQWPMEVSKANADLAVARAEEHMMEKEADATTPVAEENTETAAEDKPTEEAVGDQEKEGSVKEEDTKAEEGVEAVTEQSKEDDAVAEESTEPKAEEGAPEEVVEEPPAEGGAEQTEGTEEPTTEGETTGEAETPAAGEEEANKDDTITEETGAEIEKEKLEGEAEGGEKAEGGEEGEGDKKEGDEVAAEAEVEGGEKVEGGEGEAGAEKEQKEGDVDTAAAEGKSETPVPQSDTFADGERPESVGRVGEKLSREPTPEKEVLLDDHLGVINAESPPLVDGYGQSLDLTVYEDDEGKNEEVLDQVEQFDREALIEKYHATLSEREQLQTQNYQLQHKLAEYFRKKKADERQDYDKNVTDQEQRYLKYMAQLEDLRRQDMHERENYQIQIEDYKDKCEDKRTKVDEERQKFMEFKKQVALNAINTRSGKPIPPKDTEQYLSYENKKELEVVNVRLENIKLKNKLKKKELQLKSKEELAEGLHLIDFEQLKIENQTYNEKIEERNEELLKLRKKITSTVQVLTHLKEKLQFVQAENHVHRGWLKEVEADVAQKRDILSRTKQARDSLRIDNQRLRQSSGLLGNESLLKDFEVRMDESDDLKENLERMKMLHAELTLNCNQVRRKIEQARLGRL